MDQIDEPMIADPDVNNVEISKRYTHDTIRPISYYGAEKKVDLGFVGSCMVHKGDMKIVAQILKNLEKDSKDRYLLNGFSINSNCSKENVDILRELLRDEVKYPRQYNEYQLG